MDGWDGQGCMVDGWVKRMHEREDERMGRMRKMAWAGGVVAWWSGGVAACGVAGVAGVAGVVAWWRGGVVAWWCGLVAHELLLPLGEAGDERVE
eukprot:2940578-Prymnesium_polylepis.1